MMGKQAATTSPVYAIVDLETTGTNWKNQARIIQIGCVLVQDNQIIHQFETKVNPGVAIPSAVQQLTGIHQRDLQSAPTFDELAPSIYAMLTDTTFVAHNVNFDFSFLNMELVKAGYPELTIPAIDTVTLSQILMPTAPSFRLRDLTSYLGIEHDNPHSASSDAEATAILLMDLMRRLHELPTLTLTKLAELNLKLPEQTAVMFARELAIREAAPVNLDNAHYVSNGIVLHKIRPRTVEHPHRKFPYPRTKKQKATFFGDKYQYRPVQAKLMNSIYNQFRQPDGSQQLVIEAGTGTGKTLGYLVPLSYLAYPHGQIIISTVTNVLQKQLAQVVNEQLGELLPFQLQAVIVKGNQHYIHLGKYVRSLSMNEDGANVQLLKARLLVWLTQTTTGDLDELNLNSMRSPYFSTIQHHGLHTVTPDEPFYRDDFLIRRQQALQTANIVITNHAYLVEHAAELTNEQQASYLVVDEAQHLSHSVMRHSRLTIEFAKLATALNQLKNLVSQRDEHNLRAVFAKLPLGSYNIELLQTDLGAVEQALEEFQTALLNQLPASQATTGYVEAMVPVAAIAEILDFTQPLMIGLEQALASVQLHFNALQRLFDGRRDSWLSLDRYQMNQFSSHFAVLGQANDELHRLANGVDDEAAAFWVSYIEGNELGNLKLSGGLLAQNHYLSTHVYPHFKAMVFTGATLFTSQRSAYLYQQLDLDPTTVKTKHFGSPFDYEQQTELLIASDAVEPSLESEYLDYLATTIAEITTQNPCQTMILFNSLVTIEQVYSRLRKTSLFDQRDILAQGINGNRDKLLKQFATGTDSVLLGAASFWEGIDLPEDQLQLLIVTRLPFDSPDDVLVKAQHEHLKRQGKSPFYQVDLPQMIMRMRQGIGRLLRTDRDYGTVVILDPRLITRRYGKSVLKMLPQGMPVTTIPTRQLAGRVKKFLKTHGAV